MKRDLNLIRDLLLVIESADYPGAVNRYGLAPGEPRIQYHLRLLFEAGFIRGVGHTADGAVSVRLTWQGQEFLEMARDESVWERAKRHVIEKTHGLSAAVLQSTLAAWSMQSASEGEGWRAPERRVPDRRAAEPPPPHSSLYVGVGNGAGVHGNGNGNGNGEARRPETLLRRLDHSDWRIPMRLAPYYLWDEPSAADSNFEMHVSHES